MGAFWESLSRGSRAGLVTGVVLIALLIAGLGWWSMKTDYQVLFSDLKAPDAQAMTAELDRLKIPYRLADGGTSIWVDAATVHATRLKLMGKELPLQGAVGFELFNNTDFGMTEFAQKINYQRALQGELTRTILSIAEVSEVRVHLALPEQGLFKPTNARAKASVTVGLRQGAALRPEQVSGMQRLVAAAVPGMTMQDVTIVDKRGIALTRVATNDGDPEGGAARLDLKRDTEAYLSRKAAAVLDRLFGPGEALASVDVTLNMDQIRVTTEDVVPAAGRGGSGAAGVIVKERETLRDVPAPLDARASASKASTHSQRDVDYAVGRRVEQVIGQPGSIRRVQVVAVVRHSLDEQQREQVHRLLAGAVGAEAERGDTVVVQALNGFMPRSDMASGSQNGDAPPSIAATGDEQAALSPATNTMAVLRWVALLGLVLLGGLAYRLLRQRRPPANSTLSPTERSAALQRVQAWMHSPPDTVQGKS